MDFLLLSAGLLSLAVGIIHSILGEVLVFNKLRNNSLVPTSSPPPLQERNVRILWATWHLASFFGFAMGAILIHFAITAQAPAFIIQSIALSMLCGSLLVFYATKAKHPGWVGLLLVAVLCWLA